MTHDYEQTEYILAQHTFPIATPEITTKRDRQGKGDRRVLFRI